MEEVPGIFSPPAEELPAGSLPEEALLLLPKLAAFSEETMSKPLRLCSSEAVPAVSRPVLLQPVHTKPIASRAAAPVTNRFFSQYLILISIINTTPPQAAVCQPIKN